MLQPSPRSARIRALDARRHALVLQHLGVAQGIARRYTSPAWDGRDLEQVAYLGLVKAARQFDQTRGDEFLSYAVPTISGEVKRYLRDHGWFVRPPRSVQELRARLLAEAPRLAQRLGRVPSPADLSDAVGVDVERVREALRAGDSLRPASLDAVGDDGEQTASSIGQLEDGIERAERTVTLAGALAPLAERERRILYLRFVEERSQQQIGRELGISQMHVSRLLAATLARLRRTLGPAEAADVVGSAGAAVA